MKWNKNETLTSEESFNKGTKTKSKDSAVSGSSHSVVDNILSKLCLFFNLLSLLNTYDANQSYFAACYSCPL